MVYLIKGEVVIEEKPRKYLGKFVQFSETKEGVTTERDITITDSKKFADFLNKRGYNLQLVDDVEEATNMCKKDRTVKVSKLKIFSPKKGWERYLNEKFVRKTEEEGIVSGELKIWKETRIPTPWFYFFSKGCLEDVLIFDNNKFVTEKIDYYEEETNYGLFIHI